MKKVICALSLMLAASLSAVQYDELFDAIKQNNVLGVATILAGEDVNDFIDEDGQSPLRFALGYQSDVNIIEQLIKYGHADVNERVCDKSMLHAFFIFAEIAPDMEADYSSKVVKLFLDNGFKLDVLNPYGIPELYEFLDSALKQNNLEVVDAVFAKAETIDANVLLEILFRCISRNDDIQNYTNLLGVVDFLLDKIDVRSGMYDYNSTMLHFAAENGFLHIVEGLLNLDRLGRYAQMAAEAKTAEFESAKAKLADARDAEAKAVTAKVVAEVKLKTAKLAKLNAVASETETETEKDDDALEADVLAAKILLLEAEEAQRSADVARRAEEQAVQILKDEAQAALALTAEALAAEIANAKNCFRYTPLHDAVEGGHLDIVKLLLERGADIDAESINRTTPLQLAIDCWNEDMIKFLVDKGAAHDNALLELAINRGYKDLIELLNNQLGDGL